VNKREYEKQQREKVKAFLEEAFTLFVSMPKGRERAVFGNLLNKIRQGTIDAKSALLYVNNELEKVKSTTMENPTVRKQRANVWKSISELFSKHFNP